MLLPLYVWERVIHLHALFVRLCVFVSVCAVELKDEGKRMCICLNRSLILFFYSPFWAHCSSSLTGGWVILLFSHTRETGVAGVCSTQPFPLWCDPGGQVRSLSRFHRLRSLANLAVLDSYSSSRNNPTRNPSLYFLTHIHISTQTHTETCLQPSDSQKKITCLHRQQTMFK